MSPILAQAASPAPAPIPALRDIAPPVAPTFWETMDVIDWGLLGAAILLVAVAAWIAWRLFFRSTPKPGPPPPDPREVARERLARLRERIEELSPRDFGAEAANVLRQFVRARYGISTMRRTSEEFLAEMARDRTFSAHENGLLQRFLTQCDLLKFAAVESSHAEAGRLIEDALAFVEGAAPRVIRPEAVPPALPRA